VVSQGRVRDALLDAGYDAAVTQDWADVRMGDVASRAGVSRQTLYNEFGSKDGLARAVVLRQTGYYLQGVDEALGAASGASISQAIAAAAAYTLERAGDDPLLKAIFTGSRHDDLLPFLTTRSQPLLVASIDALRAWVEHNHPELDPGDVAVATEAAVRLTMSHLTVPLAPVDHIATSLCALIDRFLSGGQRP
jgi:AcrR family transcriptional regulator